MNLKNQDHPTFEPKKWNESEIIKKIHNCYAYALNIMNKSNVKLYKRRIQESEPLSNSTIVLLMAPKPGIVSGKFPTDDFANFHWTCAKIEKRMYADNPMIKKLRKGQVCKDGYYKIALRVYKDGTDYHFYRQDKSGLWSHKDAWRKATNLDSSGRLIKNPEKAHYDDPTIFCGYYMVPNNKKCKRADSVMTML